MTEDSEYLTVEKLADRVSFRAHSRKAKVWRPIIYEVVEEYLDPSVPKDVVSSVASAVGRELNHRKMINRQTEREDVIHEITEEQIRRMAEVYLRDAQQHELEMLEGLALTGHDPDDI